MTIVLIFNPLQTVLIVAGGNVTILGKATASVDLVPCNWHTPLSHEPPLYGIVLSSSLHHMLSLIRDSHCFTVNFVPFELKEAVIEAGRHVGHHASKHELVKLTHKPSEQIEAPYIAESVGHLECELLQELPSGDHILLVGKVLRADLRKPLEKRLFHVEGEKFTTTID
ncbi:flavin reductase family protein [Candidatus Woesearchaeota archaeon]|nr:flavin reductase family protein [Candidatus Woesearchaeota archaeon]